MRQAYDYWQDQPDIYWRYGHAAGHPREGGRTGVFDKPKRGPSEARPRRPRRQHSETGGEGRVGRTGGLHWDPLERVGLPGQCVVAAPRSLRSLLNRQRVRQNRPRAFRTPPEQRRRATGRRTFLLWAGREAAYSARSRCAHPDRPLRLWPARLSGPATRAGEAATIPTTFFSQTCECMYVFILIAVEPLVRPRPTLQDQSGWVTTSE